MENNLHDDDDDGIQKKGFTHSQGSDVYLVRGGLLMFIQLTWKERKIKKYILKDGYRVKSQRKLKALSSIRERQN